MKIRSDDAEIFYDVRGEGPDVVLLHAFPLSHAMWRPVAERLATQYRVLLIDLRGHGNSGAGVGPATMTRHAADVLKVCDDAGVGKAVFGGVSLGGYVLFELWRRSSERMAALILADTRAQADDDQGRAVRLQAAEAVEKDGPDRFLDGLLPKLVSQSTLANRPDLAREVRAMMAETKAAGIAAVQRGLASRPDSVPTLSTIHVPTLLIFGEDDRLSPVSDGALMHRHIATSRLTTIPGGGHLAVFERPDGAHEVLRNFLESLQRGSW